MKCKQSNKWHTTAYYPIAPLLGNENSCFCHKNETIKHLFLACRFARGCIQVVLNLSWPCSIFHLFGSWLRGFQKDLKPLILLEAAATYWSIWLCRNDFVFEKKCVHSPLQVVYSVIHWLCIWVILQKPYAQVLVKKLRCFSPGHMGSDLVLELIVTRVSGFSLLGFVFRQKPEVNSLLLYQLDIMTVN